MKPELLDLIHKNGKYLNDALIVLQGVDYRIYIEELTTIDQLEYFIKEEREILKNKILEFFKHKKYVWNETDAEIILDKDFFKDFLNQKTNQKVFLNNVKKDNFSYPALNFFAEKLYNGEINFK